MIKIDRKCKECNKYSGMLWIEEFIQHFKISPHSNLYKPFKMIKTNFLCTECGNDKS